MQQSGLWKDKRPGNETSEAAMNKKGRKDCCVSPEWWSRFSKRLPTQCFRKLLEMLKETLEKYNLTNKPAQIYNCDEQEMPLEHKLPKTIKLKGVKKVRQIMTGNKI